MTSMPAPSPSICASTSRATPAPWRTRCVAAANHITNGGSRDGSVIGAIQNTVPFEPFFNNKQAQFDAGRLNWLGTPTSEIAMYLVWHASRIQTLQDARTKEMIAGGAGAASTPVFYGRIFNQILGLKARFVKG